MPKYLVRSDKPGYGDVFITGNKKSAEKVFKNKYNLDSFYNTEVKKVFEFDTSVDIKEE